MKLSFFVFIFAFIFLCEEGFAQSENNETKMSLPKQELKSDQQDVADQLLTNKKLRTESGSKSKFSIAVEFDYNGGSILKPLDKNRPNIKEAAELSAYTGAEAYVSGKWNISATDSLWLGVGLRAVTPFNSKVPNGAGRRLNASNPSLLYQKISRVMGLQGVTNFSATLDTEKDILATGTVGNVQFLEDLAYDFGGSRYSVGSEVILTQRFFDRSTSSICILSDTESGRCGDYQSDYSAGLSPFFEYEINDNFSFRTELGLFVYDHARTEKRALTMNRNAVYQSVGLGISMMRDFYLFPNVQFIPSDMRADKTNVALTTFFNLF